MILSKLLYSCPCIAVCNDTLTHKLKGKTVMSDKERYESVRHCRYVDELIPDAPWTLTDDFLEKHRVGLIAGKCVPVVLGGFYVYRR